MIRKQSVLPTYLKQRLFFTSECEIVILYQLPHLLARARPSPVRSRADSADGADPVERHAHPGVNHNLFYLHNSVTRHFTQAKTTVSQTGTICKPTMMKQLNTQQMQTFRKCLVFGIFNRICFLSIFGYTCGICTGWWVVVFTAACHARWPAVEVRG